MSPGTHNLTRIAVVVSRYNGSITGPMFDGACGAFERRGGDSALLDVVDAPGAWELIALSNGAARARRYEGVLALGCIIRGETTHDRHLATGIANGLASITIETSVPVAFGVLTVESVEQAIARAGGEKGNKGAEAMDALLDTIAGLRHLAVGSRSTIKRPMPDKGPG